MPRYSPPVDMTHSRNNNITFATKVADGKNIGFGTSDRVIPGFRENRIKMIPSKSGKVRTPNFTDLTKFKCITDKEK